MSDTVESMEHTYSLHGHTRSMSSLASTIIPILSDALPMTVTASPMETAQLTELPIELRIPLPASSTCSDEEGDTVEADWESQIQSQEPVEIETKEKPPDGPLPVLSSIPSDEFADEHAKMGGPKPPSAFLDELARLVESEQYETRRGLSIRNDLGQFSFAFALNRRLTRSSDIAYRTMVEQFRANDHGGFASTYQAIENLIVDCHAAGHSTQINDDNAGENELDPGTLEEPPHSWLQKLPPAHRDGVLAFLTNIRTNKTFLSECFSNLSSSELFALTASYRRWTYGDSVFQNHSLGKIRSMGKDPQSKTFSQKVDAIRDFNQNDPYFLLLYAVFDDTLESGTHESRLRIEIWSTACAKILEDGKPGSDEFAITTLDTFAGFREWKLRPKLEIFLLKILHRGAFLLDPPQPADFTQPVEIRNAQAAVAVSQFFDDSLKELFELLVNGPTQSGVPEDALNFAHAVLSKIQDPRIRLRAKTFITSRWYFSSFISTILVYPESQGILTEYHIGETARGTILKELANRMQKQVTDVTSPWNHMTIVTPDIQTRVGQFLDVFEPALQKPCIIAIHDYPAQDYRHCPYPSQLMLSSQDVVCLIDFLCPNLSISPTTTDVDSGKAPSTASSVTGSSTLTSGSTGVGSAMASSIAPSTSGTSLASNAINGEVPFTGSQINQDISPDSLLQSLDSKAATVEVKDNSTIQLSEISNRIKESLASAETSSPNLSKNDWGFIYISKNSLKLSLKPHEDDTEEQKNNIPPKNKASSGIEMERLYFESLKEAIIKLMTDRIFFQDLILKIGAKTMASSNLTVILEGLFEMAMSTCQDSFDFGNSFFWWRSTQILCQISSPLHSRNLEKLLEEVFQNLRISLASQIKTTNQNLIWHQSLDIMQRGQNTQLRTLKKKRDALRIKMWYVSDVRHSAPYEEALHVTRALRVMASSRTKQPNSLSSWARHRLRNSFGHDRSEAQMLEIVAAPRDYGGLSKLADEQVELTTRWLTKNSIENFCKGEERIHRFCFEAQKCVNKLSGVNLLDSPVLWASRLFEREKLVFDARLPRAASYDLQYRNPNTGSNAWNQNNYIPPQPMLLQGSPLSDSPGLKSNHNISFPNKTRNFSNLSNLYNSTTPGGQSSSKFSSNSTSFPPSPTPQISVGYSNTVSEDVTAAKKVFAQEVKKSLYSLVISDLGYLLWAQGSETDVWINHQTNQASPAPQTLMESTSETRTKHGLSNHADVTNPFDEPNSNQKNKNAQQQDSILSRDHKISHPRALPEDSQAETISKNKNVLPFPYKEAYKALLERFSYSSDPYTKLQILTELETLVLNSMCSSPVKQTKATSATINLNSDSAPVNSVGSRTINIPRTKATSLEEVIANCTERRAYTLKLGSPTINTFTHGRFNFSHLSLLSTDSLVSALLQIFQDPFLRPATLFRDLQYIAAFVPPSVLDQTPQGKAFWDAGLAALALKEDLCSAMITRATQITAYHISPSSPNLDTTLTQTTLYDAACLWLITAKEGSPVAARELGLFYLTHPELLSRVTLPFSKAKDVFRATLGGDHGGGGGGGGGGLLGGGGGGGKGTANAGETSGLDALTFAVVFHWMESAANGGDRDARDFLKGNGELSNGRRNQ